MKLILVAPLPPPHHGLSIITSLLKKNWDAFTIPTESKNSKIELFFINSAISSGLEEIGGFSIVKIRRLFSLAWQIFKKKQELGPCSLYYIPATGHTSQILRDCFLLALFRPFIKYLILHWHGLGLKNHIDLKPFYIHALVRFFLGGHALSLILHEKYVSEIKWLAPKSIRVIPNGIPDPCPDFDNTILPGRLKRYQERQSGSRPPDIPTYRVLFLAHCTREKGLFDTLDAIALLNRQLGTIKPQLHASLTVAGQFLSKTEKQEFETRIRQPDLTLPPSRRSAYGGHLSAPMAVHYAGFVGGAEKDRLLRDCDCLCFPSYFPTEAQPVSLIEAMAYGLNIVVSDWRALPECLPPGAGRIVPIQRPDLLAEALAQNLTQADSRLLRAHFLEKHTLSAMIQNLRSAFQSLD